MIPIRYIRVERQSTDSWMTLELPYDFFSGHQIEEWLRLNLPDWEWVSGCLSDPDKD